MCFCLANMTCWLWKSVLLILSVLFLLAESKEVEGTDRPIIGVLAQETARSLEVVYPGQYKSFIAASYVKFLEGAGARVVPIWIGKNRDYYKRMVRQTSGLLLPGGSTWFNQTNGYGDAGVMLYELAIESNQRGEHYPILGICLGMELMMYAESHGRDFRTACDAHDITLPLEFKPGFRETKLFRRANKEVIEVFSKLSITSNYHQFCITEKNLKNLGLEDDWRVISVNHDVNEVEFISTMESRYYPFFGVQFHPEKSIYEWRPRAGIIHSRESVLACQYIADTFVESCRNSPHVYPNEQKDLIWNYPVVHTGLIPGSIYSQCYLFKGDGADKALTNNVEKTDLYGFWNFRS